MIGRRRFAVVLCHSDFDVESMGTLQREVVIGAFRTREKADRVAAKIRRLANTYEDPEGVEGEDNALDVAVWKLLPANASAREVLDVMYGSID